MKTIIGHSKAIDMIIRRFPVKRAMFLQGNTGCGKTYTARKAAELVGGTELSINETGAKLLDIETIRQWADNVYTQSMFGAKVYIINEAQDLTADQMTLLLTVLDRNEQGGKSYFIFTAMFSDGDVTGKKAIIWKPLKDRCFTPNFKIEMDGVNAYLSQWNLTAESFPECFEGDGYSIRRMFESLRDLGLEPTIWNRNAIIPDVEDDKPTVQTGKVVDRIRQALSGGQLTVKEIADATGLTTKQVFGTLSNAVRNNRGFKKIAAGIYSIA